MRSDDQAAKPIPSEPPQMEKITEEQLKKEQQQKLAEAARKAYGWLVP